MLGVLVERAWAIEDLLVLLIIVALGARFINGGDNVVRPAAAILTRLGSFWPITACLHQNLVNLFWKGRDRPMMSKARKFPN